MVVVHVSYVHRSLNENEFYPCFQIQSGSPGLVVAVSVDGNLVWSEGFGYADVENRVKCKPNTGLFRSLGYFRLLLFVILYISCSACQKCFNIRLTVHLR